MSLSTSRLAYESHYKLFERALTSPHGIRIKYRDWNACVRMRTEFHMARQVDRDENKEVHEEGEPMWGRSVYDGLRCTIRIEKTSDDPCWLYIQKIDAERQAEAVEEITYAERPSLAPPEPMKVIEQEAQLVIEDQRIRR